MTDQPGGFIANSLPSPAPSDTSSIFAAHRLPKPRPSPLRPGSRPETALIQYLDDQLLQISRKHTKKFHEGGYTNIRALIRDLEKIIDVIWISSTRTLQIPYLIQIATDFNDYLGSFPLQLKPTLLLLDKLDQCFYTLVTGSPTEQMEPLSPEQQVTYRLNMTERVRVASLCERTRLHVIWLLEHDPSDLPDDVTGDVNVAGQRSEDDIEIDTTDEYGAEEEDLELDLEATRVYLRTLQELGGDNLSAT